MIKQRVRNRLPDVCIGDKMDQSCRTVFFEHRTHASRITDVAQAPPGSGIGITAPILFFSHCAWFGSTLDMPHLGRTQVCLSVRRST